MANKRELISKKMRFEVFKRDNFTCQYCGNMAPDVILEIDHINPIKNGGDNNILNLITSCKECNRGKGAKTLNENDILKKQQEQLKELNEKQEQLKLMIKWKEELELFDKNQIDRIEEILSITGHSFSDYGRTNIKKLIRKYGFSEVYDSTKLSLEQYFEKGNEESIIKVFNYISRICVNRAKQNENPQYSKINYISAILKNRLYYYDEIKFKSFLKRNLNDNDIDYFMDLAKTVKNWSNLKECVEDYYGETL